MIIDRHTFFKSQQKLQNVPFNQTEEWINKCEYFEEQCRFFIDDIHDPQIAFWGVVFKRKFIGNHLIINGESYRDGITSAHLRKFYLEIIALGFDIIEITSLNFYDIKYEIGIRRAGFLRPLGMRLSPLTIVIDVEGCRKTDKDWRRNTRKALSAELYFKHIEKPSINDVETFCNIFSELKEKKGINYSLSSKSLFKLFNDSSYYKLFFAYSKENIPISGRIVYVRGNRSFDVYASNSYEARKVGAAYFIIDEILGYLKKTKISLFDYGMISPSANVMDAIYIAKSYSGGEPTQYNSEWVFYKSNIVELLIKGYFYFFSKSIRY